MVWPRSGAGAALRLGVLCVLSLGLFTATGVPVRAQVPANAEAQPYGKGWRCLRGFQKAGDRCEPIRLPANARLDWSGNGWRCERGFVRTADRCEPVAVPDHAELDPSGQDWRCERGYGRRGDACEALTVPENARLDWAGNSWSCNRGFARVGSACEAIRLPDHAELDWSGTNWTCVRGYRRVNNACVPGAAPKPKTQAATPGAASGCGAISRVSVEGYCDGLPAAGTLRVCSRSKSASGSLTLDNGTGTTFRGSQVAEATFQGRDGYGNDCELESASPRPAPAPQAETGEQPAAGR